jgi:hypothetical protein
MKVIKRKKTAGFLYLLLTIIFILNIVRGPSEYSFLVQILSVYGYYAGLIIIAIMTLMQSLFYFSKPFGHVWPDRLIIYLYPFKKYDIDIKSLISYSELSSNLIEVRDNNGTNYRIHTKMILEDSKIQVLKDFLKGNVEKNRA